MTAEITGILPQGARVGFYGKLPARGDFIREGVPRDFTDAWDLWWQRGLSATQRLAGDAWRESWLEAPVWRFILPPGLCGQRAVLGLWMPSVDKAGRFFPLTIAVTAEADWAPLVATMEPFLAAAEQAGRDALEHDLSPAMLLERLQDACTAPEAIADPSGYDPGRAAWWTQGGTRVRPRATAGAVLPEGGDFAALIDDSWAARPSISQPAISATAEPT